ncbi:MAG: SPASM domain-containing protein, partial [Paracoccus sp. (in: a-proteobacteria)]
LVPKRQPVVCLAVQPDAALVDAHGTLFNCTEVSYVPSYGTPNRFAIGDLTTGERQAEVRDILGSFNDQVEAGAFGCSRCPLLPVCGGACPKEWIEGRAPCPSSKRNIAQRLLLAAAFERMDRAAGDPSLPAVA